MQFAFFKSVLSHPSYALTALMQFITLRLIHINLYYIWGPVNQSLDK